MKFTDEEREIIEAALRAYTPPYSGSEIARNRKRAIVRDLADRIRVA